MGKGVARKVADAAANVVLAIVDAPHSARQAAARRAREEYAYGKSTMRKPRS